MLKKLADPNEEFVGPTARYQLETGKMRVFSSRAEVPVDFVSYEEYLASKS